MFSGDSKHGSLSDRFHAWGAPPYTFSYRYLYNAKKLLITTLCTCLTTKQKHNRFLFSTYIRIINFDRSVPNIAHWLHDVSGWYYCCDWQTDDYDCFNTYLNRRPTADCKNYQPPGYGMYGYSSCICIILQDPPTYFFCCSSMDLVLWFVVALVVVVAVVMHWGMLCEVRRDRTGSYVLSQ